MRVLIPGLKNGALNLVKSCFLTNSQRSIFPLVTVTQRSLCSRSAEPYLVHTPTLRLLSSALNCLLSPTVNCSCLGMLCELKDFCSFSECSQLQLLQKLIVPCRAESELFMFKGGAGEGKLRLWNIFSLNMGQFLCSLYHRFLMAHPCRSKGAHRCEAFGLLKTWISCTG